MSIVLGPPPKKPASPAYNGTSYRPPPIDSRDNSPEKLLQRLLAAAAAPVAPAVNAAAPLPSDPAALAELKAGIDRRLLAAQVLQAGGLPPAITVDDLARLPLERLQALRLNGPLAERFVNHRLQHDAAGTAK
jgi:hypothetical protein